MIFPQLYYVDYNFEKDVTLISVNAIAQDHQFYFYRIYGYTTYRIKRVISSGSWNATDYSLDVVYAERK